MNRVRNWWATVPTPVQIIFYVGASNIIANIIGNIQNIQALDWRAVVVGVLTIMLDILAYLVLRAKT